MSPTRSMDRGRSTSRCAMATSTSRSICSSRGSPGRGQRADRRHPQERRAAVKRGAGHAVKPTRQRWRAPACSPLRLATRRSRLWSRRRPRQSPRHPPPVITVAPAVLRSYEGNYQSASTGGDVVVAFDGPALTLAAPGQPVLQLQPVEERRFIADECRRRHRRVRRPRRHHRTTDDHARSGDRALRPRRLR